MVFSKLLNVRGSCLHTRAALFLGPCTSHFRPARAWPGVWPWLIFIGGLYSVSMFLFLSFTIPRHRCRVERQGHNGSMLKSQGQASFHWRLPWSSPVNQELSFQEGTSIQLSSVRWRDPCMLSCWSAFHSPFCFHTLLNTAKTASTTSGDHCLSAVLRSLILTKVTLSRYYLISTCLLHTPGLSSEPLTYSLSESCILNPLPDELT